MTFERTGDMELVKRILTDKRCWRRMCDDSAPAPDVFAPVQRAELQYVLARDRGRLLGLFILVVRDTAAEVHFCFSPEAWGRRTTVKTGQAFVEWVWKSTPLTWLLGPVPQHNRLALTLAKACGFSDFMTQRGCVSKGGKPYDLLTLQIRRPEYAA
jgi:RimJ/RimL family protein N-acetyltransferase